MPAGTYDPNRALLVTADEVRTVTGYKADSDVATADVEAMIRLHESLIVGDLCEHVLNLPLEGPIDGANTRFQIPRNGRSARVIFDDDLSGTEGNADALVQSRTVSTDTTPDTYATLTVSSIDATNGILTLSVAPASTVDAVLFTGRLTTRRLDKTALKAAILYQTALGVDARVREPGTVNLANPEAQRKLSESGRNRRAIWEDLRDQALRRLRKVQPRKAGVRTRLTDVPEAIRTDP